MTTKIYRQAELSQLTMLLDHKRLVTITGIAGIGKTTLAQQYYDCTEQSVIQVSLESCTNLRDAIITALIESDWYCEASTSPTLDAFRHISGVLILDNIEHMIHQSAWLNNLLETAPALRILVISRQPTGLWAEQLLPLNGLRYDSIQSPAAQLLISRVQQVCPDMDVTTQEEPLLELCRLTEGHPLALELLAGWTKVMSLTDIVKRFRQSTFDFPAITHDYKPAHHSLTTLFEATWQQLTPVEQHTLKAISFCQGTFSMEAISALTVSDRVLPHLVSLVNQSLLQHRVQGYTLHSLVRRFVHQHISADDTMDFRQHHADYYLRWLANQHTALQTGHQQTTLDAISHRFDNIEAAWHTACQQPITHLLVAAAPALALAVMMQNRLDGLPLFDAALACTPSQTEAHTVLVVHRLLVRQWHEQVNYADDTRQIQTALDNAQTRNDPELQGLCWRCLGHIAFLSSRFDDAQNAWQQSLALFQQVGDAYQTGQVLRLNGHVAHQQGDMASATAYYQQSYETAAHIGDDEGAAGALMGLGAVAIKRQQHARAERYFQQALMMQEQLGNWGRYLYSGRSLLWLYVQQGRIESIPSVIKAIQQQTDHLPARVSQPHLIMPEIQQAIIQADYDRAADLLLRIDPLQQYYPLWLVIALGETRHIAAREYLHQVASDTAYHPSPESMLLCLLAGALLETRLDWLHAVDSYAEHVPVFWLRHSRLYRAIERSASTYVASVPALEPQFEILLAHYGITPDPDTPTLLTSREVDVLQAAACGLQNKEIAQTLGIATGTVKQHLNNIYRKLNVSNRVEAVTHPRAQLLLPL